MTVSWHAACAHVEVTVSAHSSCYRAVLFTTVVVIGYEETLRTIRENVGRVELCVSFMIPPELDQIPNLQVFLSAVANPGTASMLRLNYSSHYCMCSSKTHYWHRRTTVLILAGLLSYQANNLKWVPRYDAHVQCGDRSERMCAHYISISTKLASLMLLCQLVLSVQVPSITVKS